MSMILCAKCGAFCDSDDYPEGWYRTTREGDEIPCDDFWCENCNQGEE